MTTEDNRTFTTGTNKSLNALREINIFTERLFSDTVIVLATMANNQTTLQCRDSFFDQFSDEITVFVIGIYSTRLL